MFLNAFLIYNRSGEGDPIMRAKVLVLVLLVALGGCRTIDDTGPRAYAYNSDRQCRANQIVEETVIETGTDGRQTRTNKLYVKC
ncbi:hypothetical protein [Rhizobium bangladeshense]|uniref:hypothetical protein n=1 Tax=Rhizobium bangladeshense TaxID=1138189 RepID=UPI001C834C68|nr:hypothetical protein [Rhizobium bangladeshense]MBX4912782.1 hypothetical protein [Rhizobium bangladeshense]